ncbi:heavy metal translocating P-type ATPase [bacterium]|nr:heavy metal translocating P-type ATPase [bacterium]
MSAWVTDGVSPLASKKLTSSQWDKFNLIELESQFNSSTCPLFKKFRFYIEGLQCSSCVHLLEDFPLYFSGIVSSKLNYSQRTLEVQTKPEVKLGDLCAAIVSLGYEPTPLNETADYDKAQQLEQRNELKRIGVAGAVAGNAMLFAVPIYAGLDGSLGLIFKWIMFFTFLPLMFYSAVPFYKKAWGSLLIRRINVDMMITVALWAGFIFSTYSLVMGSDDIYFDSSASFIFLILLTRYFLRQHQDKLLRKNIFDDLFVNSAYEILDQKGSHYTNFKDINPNQLLMLKRNQLLPCDSYLDSSSATFDLSFLTGEVYPQIKHVGDAVPAGSRLLSVDARLYITSTATHSNLAQALNTIDTNVKDKNTIQTLSDVVAHRLTLVVFSLAALFFIFTYQTLGFEAFKRCLALITIACPCAVAFGTPLAFSMGLKKAAKHGFFVRTESVFEKLAQIKKVIFDKTGTLTSSQFKLVNNFPENISAENKSIILGLEKASLHPLALGLKESWSDADIADIKDVKEEVGNGVEAYYNGHHYQLKKSIEDGGNGAIQADFSIDGKRSNYLFFTENLRQEATDVVNEFYKLNFDVKMLTGDKRVRAVETAKKIGIRPNFVFAEQSAQSKKQIIEQENPCLFVGDGLNDLQALNQAYVSFAIRGSFESTLQVSDVYAPQKDLHALLEIINLSKNIQSTVKINLLFAIFYNTIGGLLALAGYINPLVAAVLMPVSSFLITSHTVWRLK